MLTTPDVKINVVVKANAKKTEVLRWEDGTYRVCVQALPAEGKANAAVIAALAQFFKIPKSNIEILLGAASKKKLVGVG